ncbi:mismatch repair protein MSH3 [Rhodotorula paludigena]|uniref:mismatch repair protein MSH3 n=1 Tax=Rhodotorula paludigena TaxID=86838 RepID=UPI003179A97A
MAPKGGADAAQQTLSSFFRPAPAPKKRTQDDNGVLVLSDSDDDDEAAKSVGRDGTAAGGFKRLKTEHDSLDSQLQPIASTSKLPASTATLPRTSTGSAPTAVASARLCAFTFTQPDHVSQHGARELTAADQARRDAFVKRLSLGPNLLKKRGRSSYLQKDHYLAARDEDDDEGSSALGACADDLDEEASSEGSSTPAPSKGKGKAHDDSGSESPFARFAAKGSAVGNRNGKDASGKVKYTPLEQQVLALRKANPGVLLVIEVGYKFRFFQEDAEAASKVLNIACFPSQHMLTASIPTHRLDIHVRRLLNAGYKVGVVRQQETAALKKASDNRSAPFTRALSALYTSATYVDEIGVDPLTTSGATATLMAIVEDKPSKFADAKVKIGLVAVVPSTGQVVYDEFEDGLMRAELETRMLHLQPSELLLQTDLSGKTEAMVKLLASQHNAGADDFSSRIDRIGKRPSVSQATSTITEFYAATSQKKQGKGKARETDEDLSDIVLSSDDEDEAGLTAGVHPSGALDLPKLVLVALASLITHLEPFGLSSVFSHISSFAPFASRAAMTLNGNTVTNLELLRNNTDFKEAGSLIACIDKCRTAMGKRRLRSWITKPLLSKDLVTERLDAISAIHSSSASLTLSKLRDLLRTLPDLERGLSRIHFGRASPHELLRVLEAFGRIGKVFVEVDSPDEDGEEGEDGGGPVRSAAGGRLKSTLLRSIVRDLPRVRETAEKLLGDIVVKRARDNDKEELFADEDKYPELKACKEGLAKTANELQDELKAARKLLRKPALQFTKVAQEEYLFEVKIAEAKTIVPADWVRINATKQVHRYRSPSLQKKLDRLEQWREKVAAAANAAFHAFLQEVASHYELFRQTIVAIATADCLFSLALVALSNNWTRPTIVDEPGRIDIAGGRHPIIETVSPNPFVPNDLSFGGGQRKQMILTGLNMGGKSSLSRSVALIALLAQMGSFVPADSCTTSLFDGIYTRMGAADDVARGRSTFMVELSEASEILRLATARSLIILDELGRGTSTHDGQAIASAVLEHLICTTRATTLFVTHYPALALLARRYPESVSVNHMACLESQPKEGELPDVTFLYKLADGLASASHGLNVARLAELPQEVVDVARRKGDELRRETEGRLAKRKEARLAEVLRRVDALPKARSRTEGEDASMNDEDGRETLDMCGTALLH